MALEEGQVRHAPSTMLVIDQSEDDSEVECALIGLDDEEDLESVGEDEIIARLEAMRSEVISPDPYLERPSSGETVDVDDVLVVDRNLPSEWVDDEHACSGAAMLESVAQLRRVHLDRERLTTLRGIASTHLNVAVVTHLYIQTNFITSLEPLAPLINLVFLAAMNNELTDIRCLAENHTRLIFLDAEGNKIGAVVPESDIPKNVRHLNLRGNPCFAKEDGARAWRFKFCSVLPALEVLNREPLTAEETSIQGREDDTPEISETEIAAQLEARDRSRKIDIVATEDTDEMLSDIERITLAMAAVSSSGGSSDAVKAAVKAVNDGRQRLSELRQTMLLKSEARRVEVRAEYEIHRAEEHKRRATSASPLDELHKEGAALEKKFARFRERQLSEGLLQRAESLRESTFGTEKDCIVQDAEGEEEYEAEELA